MSSRATPVPLGLVLSGGQSTRMGYDKGLILHQGLPWFIHAQQKLSSLGLEVVVNVNAAQRQPYAAWPGCAPLVVDKPLSQGPLRGLLSVHVLFPERDLLVLPPDMLYVKCHLLADLLTLSTQQQGRIVAYESPKGVEPFPAIYPARVLAEVALALARGEWPSFAMKYLLEKFEPSLLPWQVQLTPEFRNLNRPEDLLDQ
ncbi:MAG: molybdenum cofactor guanylyltransferase [Cytophagales bacterium]|nr:molybdenum cofactor guanylyltransferase [Cytophagales bacterium]